MSTIYYNKNGSEFLDDTLDNCAKKVGTQYTKGKKNLVKYEFFVREIIDGIEKGRLYNPVSIYHVEGSSNSFIKDKGEHKYKYIKVSEQVFDLYVKFLQTKNTAYLKNAERGL